MLDAEPRSRAPDEGGERNGEEAEEVEGGQAPALHRVRDPEVRAKNKPFLTATNRIDHLDAKKAERFMDCVCIV